MSDQKEFFLEKLIPMLESVDLVSTKTSTGIKIFNERINSSCSLIFEKVNLKAIDGINITYFVKIYKDCRNLDERINNLTSFAKLNAYSSLLSFVKEDDTVSLVAKFTLYKDHTEEQIRFLYMPLTLVGIMQSFGLSKFVEGSKPNAFDMINSPSIFERDEWFFGIPNDLASDNVKNGAEQFNAAEQIMENNGIVCFSDEKGLTAEFPWEKDSPSVILGLASEDTNFNIKTSLFQIKANQTHPFYGNGLLVTLQLPFDIKAEVISSIVNSINLWELRSADMTPFFGSWCTDKIFNSASYNLFIPSMYTNLISIQTITGWMFSRHKQTKLFFRTML